MKSYKVIFTSLSLFLIFNTVFSGCKKGEISSVSEVTTADISLITPVSAVVSGTSGDSKNENPERGVCWSKKELPTISDYKSISNDCSCSQQFSCNVKDLEPNTKYYVRAYFSDGNTITYGNELTFATPVDHTGETGTVRDIAGNEYKTIGIGSQIWMAENLNTTKLNDSTDITYGKCFRCWGQLASPGYCWYDNDDFTNKYTYGAIYNWYAVKSSKLCPAGWHVPSYSEWDLLETYLGGENVAGGKLKAIGENFWKTPNTSATNESQFSAMPGGYRGDLGSYLSLGEESIFWTSSPLNEEKSLYRGINYDSGEIIRGTNPVGWGASVRCMKD